ncbi:molecular chaperone [Escherichia coli]|uniref:fimbrial biogenesis chaperone n=1 Tax=Escherichia coli TaxID=562 RepID=UPI0009834DF3|nr:molecular chaperone [Escherichia coli]MCA7593748.1 molecular chaperone [Escherichia coli]MQI96119.1 molecular chaperone [Escherichia coli]HBN0910107.1 molecular chaperone [Escherichia coli]
MTHFFSRFILMPILLATAFQLQAAGFGINATRLIYPANAGSISVTVRNTETKTPYLVQAKISRTQDTQTPAPFAVTPPLFRLEPQSTNQLRIAFTSASLPSDRESIFYLHATAIPASNAVDSSQAGSGIYGGARFGVGNIIKLFYRPQGLQGTSAAAQKKLQFSIVDGGGGLKVINSSAYYVSLAELSVGGQKLALNEPSALMLPPFGSHTWSVKKTISPGSKVEWKAINDIGGIDAFSAVIP